MSPRLTNEPSGGAKSLIAVVVVGVLAVGMFLLVRRTPEVTPFDPKSGAGVGTLALVKLLEANGATVEVTGDVPVSAASRRLVILDDRLSEDQRDAVLDFADNGGVVIVADPDSPLNATTVSDRTDSGDLGDDGPFGIGGPADLEDEINLRKGTCTIGALQHLRGLRVSAGVTFDVSRDDPQCFTRSGRSFVIVRSVGDGLVVALGDNELFTNDRLRFADNSGLAVALMAPTRGTEVVYLRGAEAPKTVADTGTGERTLSDLVRPGVWMALAQLAIAFVVLAVARAIRPGRPVREPRPVPLASSDAVMARGNLMQRARHATRAGWLIRGQLYRDLCSMCRLPPTVPVADLDAAVVALGAAGDTGASALRLGEVAQLLGREVGTDAELVELGRHIADLRQRLATRSSLNGVYAAPSSSSPSDPPRSADQPDLIAQGAPS